MTPRPASWSSTRPPPRTPPRWNASPGSRPREAWLWRALRRSGAQARAFRKCCRGVVVKEAARLVLPQPGIGPVEAEQFLVGALLGDLAMVEHDQLVHARDRAQPV